MKCPVDGATLVMADRMGIEIDYCPQCRGVWLDRGELDKLIERAAPPVALPEPRAAAPGPGGAGGALGAGLGGALGAALGGALGSRGAGGRGYGEAGERGRYGEGGEGGEHGDWRGDDDDGYRRHKKRKGLLGDIFDF